MSSNNQPQYTPEERAQYRRECEGNAARLEERISRLISDYNLDFGGQVLEEFGFLHTDRNRFWDEVKEITELFRTIRPTRRDDRDRQWTRFQEAIGSVKRIQAQERSHSEYQVVLLLDRINDAKGHARYAEDTNSFNEAFGILADVKVRMGEVGLTRQDRGRVWDAYREAQDLVHEWRGNVQSKHHQHLQWRLDQIDSQAYQNPHEAIQEYKGWQDEVRQTYLSRDQHEDLRERSQFVWQHITERLDELRAERERKQNEWRERQEENLSRWEEQLERKEGLVSRLEDQISTLESQIWSSNNSDFIERAEGWIEEKREIIRSAEDRIADLRSKIEDVQSRLR